uniref:Uncharacterized protein n=1 Tax=Schlesneria paludicola TaxID=360056 RepID=A0A7C2K228_9PLAN
MAQLASRRAYAVLLAALVVGCGGPVATPSAPPAEPTVELGESSTEATATDPTPILPIPDDAPGTDPDAASKVPINPIPDDTP